MWQNMWTSREKTFLLLSDLLHKSLESFISLCWWILTQCWSSYNSLEAYVIHYLIPYTKHIYKKHWSFKKIFTTAIRYKPLKSLVSVWGVLGLGFLPKHETVFIKTGQQQKDVLPICHLWEIGGRSIPSLNNTDHDYFSPWFLQYPIPSPNQAKQPCLAPEFTEQKKNQTKTRREW